MAWHREIILLPEAESDVNEAYWWYEDKSVGLGEEFLRCLEAGFAGISENPHHYPVRFDTFRRILLRRFPYAVYFEDTETTVTIYYVFHGSLNPEKLKQRLKPTDQLT